MRTKRYYLIRSAVRALVAGTFFAALAAVHTLIYYMEIGS